MNISDEARHAPGDVYMHAVLLDQAATKEIYGGGFMERMIPRSKLKPTHKGIHQLAWQRVT
jgi:hypothetical protein